MSEFRSDRKKCVNLNGKVSESVNVVSGVNKGSVLGQLFIMYTSELFRIVGNHIVGYADDTTTYAVNSRLLSRPQEIELLIQNLAAFYSWCLKWHIRLNSKNTKGKVVCRSMTHAPGYGDFTLGGAELDQVKSLRILGPPLTKKFETHLLEVLSKVARSLGVVRWAGTSISDILIVRVFSSTVAIHRFCPTCSIVPLYGCRLWSLS